MKAWLLDQLNGIENLRLADIADPVAGPGEVVVKLQFAGLNPADQYLAIGQYPAKPMFPHVLGRDGLGEIESLGPGISHFKVGDAVILLRSEVGMSRWGTFAQKVVVPVESLARVPAGWTHEQAAGAALVYLTAHQALNQWGELKPSVVLVTGASGGVGVASVQLAAAAGHTVIALSRNAAKREMLLQLGAKHCVDPTDPKWASAVKKLHKVDLAIDSIGGDGFNQLLIVMGYEGKVSVVGRLAGPVSEFNTASLFFRRIKIGGVAVGDYSALQSQIAWMSVVETLDRAKFRPLVDSIFDFNEILAGFKKLRDGPMGKVLLQM